MNLNFSFLKYCKNNNFEINKNQLKIIDNLNDYYKNNFNQNLLTKFLWINFFINNFITFLY